MYFVFQNLTDTDVLRSADERAASVPPLAYHAMSMRILLHMYSNTYLYAGRIAERISADDCLMHIWQVNT